MNLLDIFKPLFGMASHSASDDTRSIVIMQREAHLFSEAELQAAGERGWGKRFDGKEDPMYFVSVDHAVLTVVKAGSVIIRVTSIPKRYADDDEYALSNLPQTEQKKAWTEHHACTYLDLFNDFSSKETRISDADAYSSIAKLALQLVDQNCSAVYLPARNLMMPNEDDTADQGLRLMINKGLLNRRGDILRFFLSKGG